MPQSVLSRFLTICENDPGNVAIDEGDKTTTYGELGSRVRQFAAVFAQSAEQPRVMIYLSKTADAYAAMFGALFAGGFYTPVNDSISVERVTQVFETLQPDIIVSDQKTWRQFTDQTAFRPDAKLVFAAELSGNAAQMPAPAAPHDLAYVIFTSGSTGRPKGVMIPQAAIANYVQWAKRDMQVTPQDRWSQHPNIGFDLSVLDIYGSLCCGATLVVFKSESDRLFAGRAAKTRRLSIWNTVPSVISLLTRTKQLTSDNFASVRLMTFCGEPLLKEHLDDIFAVCPDMVVHNTYGPTEATVSCTLVRLTKDNYLQHCKGSVAIGDPIDNMKVQLLGGATENEGEIVISGPQLARGYMKNREQTEVAFKPIGDEEDAEIGYFTGDWAVREGENIYFSSRIDFQVKVKGYRLELDEVNAAMRKVGLGNVASIVHDNAIIAFVEGDAPRIDNPDELRKELEPLLESYAIPAQFIQIDELPRNANDKTDIKQLAQLYGQGKIS